MAFWKIKPPLLGFTTSSLSGGKFVLAIRNRARADKENGKNEKEKEIEFKFGFFCRFSYRNTVSCMQDLLQKASNLVILRCSRSQRSFYMQKKKPKRCTAMVESCFPKLLRNSSCFLITIHNNLPSRIRFMLRLFPEPSENSNKDSFVALKLQLDSGN